jgi:hypothetical protein
MSRGWRFRRRSLIRRRSNASCTGLHRHPPTERRHRAAGDGGLSRERLAKSMSQVDSRYCLKARNREVDVVIAANLMTFTRVWLGYAGLRPQ